MLRREMVGPRNFVARLAAIPRDGSDVLIEWEAGRYDWATLLRDQGQGSPLNFIHPTGKIVMKARGDVRIVPPDANATYSGVSAFFLRTLNIVGSDIYVVGFTIEGEETPVNWVVGEPQSYRRFSLIAGNGYRDGSGNFTNESFIAPSRIHFSDMTITGRTQLIAECSNNPAIYTEAIFDNIRINSCAQNGALVLNGTTGGWTQSRDWGCYAHARFEDISGYAVSGPDSTVRGTQWVNSSHSEGGAAITMNPRFGGDTTVEIHRLRWTNTLNGSLNHDGHAVQLVGPHGSSSYVLLRDCHFVTDWAAGWLSGNGGGGGILHQVYGHSASPNWPITGSRPRWDIEHCSFHGIIRNGVLQLPDGTPGGAPSRSLVEMVNSVDCHFWDCHFKWDVPSAYGSDLYALRVRSNYIYTAYHSCTFDFGPYTPRHPHDAATGLVDSVHVTDSATRQFSGHTPTHGRPMPAEYGMFPEAAHPTIGPDFKDLIEGEGSFDGALTRLTLSGSGVSVTTGSGVVDGTSCLELVSRYSPGGDLAVNGDFETGDLTGWDTLDTLSGVSGAYGTHGGSYAGYLEQQRAGLGSDYGSILVTQPIPCLRDILHTITFWVDSYDSPSDLTVLADLDGDGVFETNVDILTTTAGWEDHTYGLLPTVDSIAIAFSVGVPAPSGKFRWLVDDLTVDSGVAVSEDGMVTTGTLEHSGAGHYLSSSACVTPDATSTSPLKVYVDEADGLGFVLLNTIDLSLLTNAQPNPIFLATSQPVSFSSGQARYRLLLAPPATPGQSSCRIDAWRIFYGTYDSSVPPNRNRLDASFATGWTGGTRETYAPATATPLVQQDSYHYALAATQSAVYEFTVDTDCKPWGGWFYFRGYRPWDDTSTPVNITQIWKLEWLSGTWGDITLCSGSNSVGVVTGPSASYSYNVIGPFPWTYFAVPPPGSTLRLTVTYNTGGTANSRLLIDAPVIG